MPDELLEPDPDDRHAAFGRGQPERRIGFTVPRSNPRPRAPIWGESWTVGHDTPNALTVLTLYDSVPLPRLDIRLNNAQREDLIEALGGSAGPTRGSAAITERGDPPVLYSAPEQTELINSDVPQNITRLGMILPANSRVLYSGQLRLNADDAVMGAVVDIACADAQPNNGQLLAVPTIENVIGTQQNFGLGEPVTAAEVALLVIDFEGIYEIGANRVTIYPTMAQNVATENALRMLNGSWVRYEAEPW